MKKVMIFSALIMAPIVLAVAIWLIFHLLVAFQAARFTTAFEKVNETKPPLSTDQVQQVLGQPIRIEHAESTGLTGDVYHYATYPPGEDFKVIFVNGVVFQTAIAPSTPKS